MGIRPASIIITIIIISIIIITTTTTTITSLPSKPKPLGPAIRRGPLDFRAVRLVEEAGQGLTPLVSMVTCCTTRGGLADILLHLLCNGYKGKMCF